MSVRIKLIGIILLIATAPPAISAWMALRVHQRAFEDQVAALHRKTAEHGAKLVEWQLGSVARGFRLLLDQVEWAGLTDEERRGALWLAYNQQDDAAVVALLDERGAGLGPSVYADGAGPRHPAHPAADPALLGRFARAIPFAEARREVGYAVGTPVAGAGGRKPIVPLAFPVDGRDPGAPWVVAIGLSLRSTCAALERSTDGGIELLLVDGQRRLLCDHGADRALTPVDERLPRPASRAPAGVTIYRDAAGRELAGTAVALDNGWSIAVQQPTATAFASGRQLRGQALLLILLSLIAAAAAGAILADGVLRPVAALVRGAVEFGRSNFAHRLDERGGDEFTRLSCAFNRMGAEIEQRDREILAWNAELQRRVEERTAELREAQTQLLQSQKIAAVSSLGAGFAHEINNPLTSVLGFTQILLARARREGAEGDARLLERVESESLRIKGIVATLLGLSHEYAGEGFVDADANRLLDEALESLDGQLAAGGIELVRGYTSELPAIPGKLGELRQALTQICRNAITAMPGGGRLTVSTASIENQAVKIALADTGVGIAAEHLDKIFDPFFTTKGDWHGQGLGLTVAFRVIQQHHGKIQVASQVGTGTTFTIILPSGGRRSHLP